jgi:hypothetical protein
MTTVDAKTLGEEETARPRFPVIDAHNHLWSAWQTLDGVVQVMDACGVAAYADLTANMSVRFAEGGYVIGPGRFDDFLENTGRFPGRFFGFTTSLFCRPAEEPLCGDVGDFVEEAVAVLEDHVRRGARGLKILKEFGLKYRDTAGTLLRVDDPRFAPLWDGAARLEVPVLIHQADPAGFFKPVTPDNEHYESLKKFPAWSFVGARYPGHAELLGRLETVIARHRQTVFFLPHAINWPENLPWVAAFLDRHPNVRMDFSARCDDLGRQPEAAHDFILRYQDRLYFGTDMPASVAMYRFHYRFLETVEPDLIPPDYDGTFTRHRWKVRGLGLPDPVLRKLYHGNALAWIPGLKAEIGSLG